MIEQSNNYPDRSRPEPMPEQSVRRIDVSAKQSSDPWVHRSAGLLCKTCIWYSPKASIATLQGLESKLGRCRRHAPTMNGYPVVYMTDWCGDHRIDENKI